jgi:putative nucleotidyltransferase with HDIG domain
MTNSYPSTTPESSSPGFSKFEQPMPSIRLPQNQKPLFSELILSGLDDSLGSLKDILEQLPVAIKTTDDHLRLTSNFGALARELDTNPEQYLGCRMNDYLRKDNANLQSLEMYEKALAGESVQYEMEFGSRYMQTYIEPLRNSGNQVVGTIGVTVDLTDHITSEQVMKQRMEQLGILKKVFTACSEANNLDDLFEGVIKALSGSMYRENVGILLVDEASETLIRHPSCYSIANNHDMDRIPIGLGIKGMVARTGRLNRISETAQNQSFIWVEPGIKSEICVPIRENNRVFGVIDVESGRQNAFNHSDEELLLTIAGQISIGIQRIKRDQEDLRRNTELESLHQVNLRLSNSREIQGNLGSLLENALRLVSADETVILLVDASGLTFAADAWSQEYAQNPVSASKIKEIAREVVSREKSLTWPGVNGNMLRSAIPSRMSVAGIPLFMENRIKGVLITAYMHPHIFSENDLGILELLADQAVFAVRNAELSEELENAYLQTVLSLAKTVDTRDSDTSDHSQKISILAEATARMMGKDDSENRSVFWAALLHDIGKIGVPDAILRKPGPLTEEEWRIMRKHPELGAEIVIPVKRFEDVAPIIMSHHERFDGTGYPKGLKGKEIPIGGRIVAVVDAFTAITSDRVYSRARSIDEAIRELRANSGTQFDPDVVQAFITLLTELEPGKPA